MHSRSGRDRRRGRRRRRGGRVARVGTDSRYRPRRLGAGRKQQADSAKNRRSHRTTRVSESRLRSRGPASERIGERRGCNRRPFGPVDIALRPRLGGGALPKGPARRYRTPAPVEPGDGDSDRRFGRVVGRADVQAAPRRGGTRRRRGPKRNRSLGTLRSGQGTPMATLRMAAAAMLGLGRTRRPMARRIETGRERRGGRRGHGLMRSGRRGVSGRRVGRTALTRPVAGMGGRRGGEAEPHQRRQGADAQERPGRQKGRHGQSVGGRGHAVNRRRAAQSPTAAGSCGGMPTA